MSQIGNQIAVPKRPSVAGRLLRIPNLVEAKTTVTAQQPELHCLIETEDVAPRDLSNAQPVSPGHLPLGEANDTPSKPLAMDGAAAVRVGHVGVAAHPDKLGTQSPARANRPKMLKTHWRTWLRAWVQNPLAKKIVKPAIFIAVLFAAYALATFFAGSANQSASNSEDAVIVEEITAVTSQPLRAAPRREAKPRPVDEMFNVSPNLRVNVGARKMPSNSNRYQGGQDQRVPDQEVQATRPNESDRAGLPMSAAHQPEGRETERPTTVAQRQPRSTNQARFNSQPPRTELTRGRPANPRNETHQVARPLVTDAGAEEGRSIYRYDSTDPATYREPDFDIPTVADRPGRRFQ